MVGLRVEQIMHKLFSHLWLPLRFPTSVHFRMHWQETNLYSRLNRISLSLQSRLYILGCFPSQVILFSVNLNWIPVHQTKYWKTPFMSFPCCQKHLDLRCCCCVSSLRWKSQLIWQSLCNLVFYCSSKAFLSLPGAVIRFYLQEKLPPEPCPNAVRWAGALLCV